MVYPAQKTLYIPVIQIPNHMAFYMSKIAVSRHAPPYTPIIGPLFLLRAFMTCSRVNFTFMDFSKSLYTATLPNGTQPLECIRKNAGGVKPIWMLPEIRL